MAGKSKPVPLRMDTKRSRPISGQLSIDPRANEREGKQRELLKALNAASQSAGKSWLFFVSLLAYLFVAMANVTHTDLLLNAPVKLPVLQIEIPLATFFLVTPLLVILVHFGALLHHAMLSQKAAAWNNLLKRDEESGKRNHGLRLELSSYFFTQNEVGPERGLILHVLLRSMTFLTLNLLPLCLLLYFQIAFLPAHDATVTWCHRLDICLDILVLVLVGLATRRTQDGSWRDRFLPGLYSRNAVVSFVAWGAIVCFSVGVVTLPSGSDPWLDIEKYMSRLWPTRVPFDWTGQTCSDWRGDRCAFWLTAVLFEQPVDFVEGRAGWRSRNFVVTNKLLLSRKREANQEETLVSLRGRDLRYGTFDRTNFNGVDFTAADLTGASLKGAQLKDIEFGCAFRGNEGFIGWSRAKEGQPPFSEKCTSLTRADLSEAKLTNICFACLNRVQLEGTAFRGTDLSGFDFQNASLARADLGSAVLRGANFSGAYLAGAELSRVSAEGALFRFANLQGSSLIAARLEGADFRGANLSGSDLRGASLVGTDLSAATLFGADLHQARVWQTNPSTMKAFTLARTARLQIKPPADEELKVLAEINSRLKELERAEKDRLLTVLDPRKREGWRNSSERRSWDTLNSRNEQNSDQEYGRQLGRYMGDVACVNVDVFRAIVGNTFQPYGLGYGDTAPIQQPVPPSVTEKDLEALRGTYANDFVYPVLVDRPGYAETLQVFNERIHSPDCATTKQISVGMLDQFRLRIEAVSKRKVETDPTQRVGTSKE